jgi:hypothetical protein
VAKRPRGGVRYATAPVPFPRDRDPGVGSWSVGVDLGATEGAAAQLVHIDVTTHAPRHTEYEESGAPDGSPLPGEEAWEDIGSLCRGT